MYFVTVSSAISGQPTLHTHAFGDGGRATQVEFDHDAAGDTTSIQVTWRVEGPDGSLEFPRAIVTLTELRAFLKPLMMPGPKIPGPIPMEPRPSWPGVDKALTIREVDVDEALRLNDAEPAPAEPPATLETAPPTEEPF
jgi:hypothetical protein